MRKVEMILSLMFILCAFKAISAQKNDFSDENLTVLKKNAWKTLEETPYRLTIITTASDAEYKTIREVIPPDREHYISESKTSKGIKLTETIRIGIRKFEREDNGEWKESALSGSGNGSGNGSGSGSGAYTKPKIEKKVERKLKKNTSVNKLKADLYEVITTTTFILQTGTFSNVSSESYWFDKDGRILKSEYLYKVGANKTSTRTNNDYDYNAVIKIEAPILDKAAK